MLRTQSDRVWVALERDESGYPPWEEEWLWAEPIGGSQFRVTSVPIFARGLSIFDIVDAVEVRERRLAKRRWFAERVVASSGHSTLRVILFRDEAHDAVLRLCADHGSEASHTEIPGLFAVDVPPTASLVDLLRDLRVHADDGDWDIDEANIAAGHDWLT